MRTKSQRVIGVSTALTLAFFRHILEGVRRYAEERPNWLIVPVTLRGMAPRVVGEMPDGLIAAVETAEAVDVIKSFKRPVVDVSLIMSGLPCSSVRVENDAVGELAFSHLQDCGLRQFAFIGCRQWLFSRLREEAFCQAAGRQGVDVRVFNARARGEYDPVSYRWPADNRVHRWLKDLPKPVGIFVPNDLFGLQITEVCRRLDLRVPDDVAVLGVDDDELLCSLSRPRLSSIALPTLNIGYQAARLLDRLIDRPRKQPVQMLLPPVGIVPRQSTDVLATDDREVVAAIRFVRNHAYLPLRITDVLREVPVGRRTLERRVRSFLGHSLGTEIRRAHLTRAQRLLASTEMTISEIARHSGYRDSRHLAVAFREALGLTASEYRQTARGGQTP